MTSNDFLTRTANDALDMGQGAAQSAIDKNDKLTDDQKEQLGNLSRVGISGIKSDIMPLFMHNKSSAPNPEFNKNKDAAPQPQSKKRSFGQKTKDFFGKLWSGTKSVLSSVLPIGTSIAKSFLPGAAGKAVEWGGNALSSLLTKPKQ